MVSKVANEKLLSEVDCNNAFDELEESVYAALKTYSNVHRGTGHNSLVTTELYEAARALVLDHLGYSDSEYEVVFCTPLGAELLREGLPANCGHLLSSRSLGLPLGVRALVLKCSALPRGVPVQTGGGVVKHVSTERTVWADGAERFEAGTPGIVNVIAFARALQLTEELGEGAFRRDGRGDATATKILDGPEDEPRGRELLLRLRAGFIGRDLRVPTVDGWQRYVNLDNGASTPTHEPVWRAVRRTWRSAERVWDDLVEGTRDVVARVLGAPLDEYDVLFAANTTEALNLAARALVGREDDEEPVVVNTLLEHHSNELPWRYHPRVSLVRLPVDEEGFVDPELLEEVLRAHNVEGRHGRKRVRVVAVSGASNVLGSFNDLEALGRLAHAYGARLLVDGAQLVAHRRVQMAEEGIDCLAFSAHKAYAPFGSGGLVVRKGLLSLSREELEEARELGEENVAGIAALGRSLTLVERVGLDLIEEDEALLTARLLRGLASVPRLRVYGVRHPASPRFPQKGGVVAFSLDEVPHNLAAKLLAEYGGIGVRSGCFCAHLLVTELLRIHPLRVLAADMGLAVVPEFTKAVLPGLVRASLGLENDAEDVDRLIATLERIVAEPRSSLERFLGGTGNGLPRLPHTETEAQIEAFVKRAVAEVFDV